MEKHGAAILASAIMHMGSAHVHCQAETEYAKHETPADGSSKHGATQDNARKLSQRGKCKDKDRHNEFRNQACRIDMIYTGKQFFIDADLTIMTADSRFTKVASVFASLYLYL